MDVKLNVLAVLISATILFLTLLTILQQEYPNEFLLQNLQKKDSTYTIESREHGTLLANITMEEEIMLLKLVMLLPVVGLGSCQCLVVFVQREQGRHLKPALVVI